MKKYVYCTNTKVVIVLPKLKFPKLLNNKIYKKTSMILIKKIYI